MAQPISSKPKRHCMVVHAYYPVLETRVQREAEVLIRHGYEVDVICLRWPTEPVTDMFNGVPIYRMPVRRNKRLGPAFQFLEYLAFFFLAMIKLASLHRRRHYSTVQVHNPPDFLVLAAWVPKLFGARVILDLHDLMPEFYMERFGHSSQGVITRLVHLQERLSCRFADHVITVSQHWRQALIARSVPADKCSVVMNVADHTVFYPPEEPEARHADNSSFRLIYHGVVGYRHGLDLVLRAVSQVRQQIPGIHLTIRGTGEYLSDLMNLAEELDLGERVRFALEALPLSDLRHLILSADVGLAPYRNDVFTDGIVPTKLMEYAALGMPAIAARTSAIEAYFRGTMVEFFTPGDVDDLCRCILTLWQNPARQAELARGAKAFNQRFNWASIGSEYVRLVDRLCTS
jgi:glycosyltransferase involved in cell wall biosynthesis